MRREFEDRADLIDYLRREFPQAAAVDPHVSVTRGGRRAAEAALARIDPLAYRRTRNALDGAVTRLSPYIRHGVLGLDEVRNAALAKVHSPQEASKLINELGWRDYFQRVYAVLGRGIWTDLEPYKTGFAAADYAAEMPADVVQGNTGLACVDAFSRELRETGYLHNHVRMWLAAYVVHFRRVGWQAGARWFLHHLLDGDPASNNLSWQWVASTFSHKPYIFNRENLEKYTDGVYCAGCPLRGACDFEGSYEALSQRLFPHGVGDPRMSGERKASLLAAVTPPAADHGSASAQRPLVWIHGDNLSPNSPALKQHFAAPAVWVWDDELLARRGISLKRIVFLYECLLELPVEIRRGDVAREVLQCAGDHGADSVVTNGSPSPRFRTISRQIAVRHPLFVLEEAPFVEPQHALDLRRFSRYWRKVEQQALRQ